MKNKKQPSGKQAKTPINKGDFLFRHAMYIYLFVISMLFLSNYNRIFDEKIDMNGDNIHYYSTGKALSEGKGFTDVMSFTESPHTHFPPGYPVFISLLTKCGFGSIHVIKVANGILLFASLILFYFILSLLGCSRIIAFVSTVFTASHPQLLRFSTIMMSEMLFILLSCAVILIMLLFPPEKLFINSKKRWRDIFVLIGLALCISYIYFVRVMGLTLILAVIAYYGFFTVRKLYILLKNRNKYEVDIIKMNKIVLLKYMSVFLLVCAAFYVSKMAWDARNTSINKTGDAYTGAYFGKIGGGNMENIADWSERLKNNTSNYIAIYIPTAIFQHNAQADFCPSQSGKWPTSAQWVGGIIILLIMLFGVAKLKNGLIIFLYVGITIAVLFGWQEQYGGHRYMTPIIPFLVFLLIFGCFSIFKILLNKVIDKQNEGSSKILAVAVCVVFTVSVQPAYSIAVSNLEQGAKYKKYNRQNASLPFLEYIEASQWINKNLSETARIACRKPEIFYIFSNGRKSCGIPQYATPEEVLSNFEKSKINYVIIDWWFRHAYHTVVPCIQKYPEHFRIVNQIGGSNGQAATYIVEFLPNANKQF